MELQLQLPSMGPTTSHTVTWDMVVTMDITASLSTVSSNTGSIMVGLVESITGMVESIMGSRDGSDFFTFVENLELGLNVKHMLLQITDSSYDDDTSSVMYSNE